MNVLEKFFDLNYKVVKDSIKMVKLLIYLISFTCLLLIIAISIKIKYYYEGFSFKIIPFANLGMICFQVFMIKYYKKIKAKINSEIYKFFQITFALFILFHGLIFIITILK